MIKVLFVCTSNICRSPTAHGIMRDRLLKAGLSDRITVESAATDGYHVGERPDRRSLATAAKHGIDISDLRARQVALDDFTTADVIAVMENKHHARLLTRCPVGQEHRIKLLLSFIPNGTRQDVPDPYFGDESFDQIFALIEAAIEGLLDHLKAKYLLA
ncbi:MAG TPA: low molecular weight phosphotyrosine protein phosphatase [Rhodospirillaceae bacterium]|nr:low molecular weight phosphotyrosine protein phosphatase [Rhodospirillaceae bacterium]